MEEQNGLAAKVTECNVIPLVKSNLDNRGPYNRDALYFKADDCTIVAYPTETWRPGWAAATATRGCWTAAAVCAAAAAEFCSASGSHTCSRRRSTCQS